MWFEELARNNQLILKTSSYNNIPGNAVFNENGTRRYFLEKRWAEGENILTALMMNPSNAAHNQTDKTVDQMIEVAIGKGCNALYVVNISSIIDGKSSNLKNAQFSYEEINWKFISSALAKANIIFLGWGLKGQQGLFKQQKNNPAIADSFEKVSSKLYCYEVLKSEKKIL